MTSLRGRVHSALRELRVSVSTTVSVSVGASGSSSGFGFVLVRSTSIRTGHEMKSEYFLTISRSFHSAV